MVKKLEYGSLADERRTITEVWDEEKKELVQTFLIHARIPLGNHYHTLRTEEFYLMLGKGTVFTGKDKENITETKIEPGAKITIEPGVIHAFILEPGSVMTCRSNGKADSNDMPRVIIAE